MDKVIRFIKASEIDIPSTDRRKRADFCIRKVTGGYVPMPDDLKQPMIDAIRGYAEKTHGKYVSVHRFG